jgi:hypothetical protein
LDDSGLVPHSEIITDCTTSSVQTITQPLDTSIGLQSNSSTSQKDGTYLSLIREKLEAQGLAQSFIKIILASWRAGTHGQYEYQSQMIKWQEFCEQHRCKAGLGASGIDISKFKRHSIPERIHHPILQDVLSKSRYFVSANEKTFQRF